MARKVKFAVLLWEDHQAEVGTQTDETDLPPAIMASVGFPTKRGRDRWVVVQTVCLSNDSGRFAERLCVIGKNILAKVTKCQYCGKPLEVDPVALIQQRGKK